MKVTIEIECETTNELLTHLELIRRQVKRTYSNALDEIPTYKKVFSDNNCYGSHEVIISPEGNYIITEETDAHE